MSNWNLLVIGIIIAAVVASAFLLHKCYIFFRPKAKVTNQDFENFLKNLSALFYHAHRLYIVDYNGPQRQNAGIALLIAKYVADSLGKGYSLEDMPKIFNNLKKVPWTDTKSFGTGYETADNFTVSMLPNIIMFYKCHSENGFTVQVCHDFLSISIENKVIAMLQSQNPQN